MAVEIFTIFYFLLCAGIIYPPVEFVCVGLTIENVFSKLLGAQTDNFVKFHIKRSMLSLFVFSLFPVGYILCLLYFGYTEVSFLFRETPNIWKIFITTSVILPLLALYQIKNWYSDNYKYHPTVANLSKFLDNRGNWESVASDINIEYRRITKVSLKVNPVVTVVVTDSWVLKVCPFVIHIAKLNDTDMQVTESRLFDISEESTENQVLKVEVKSRDQSFESFHMTLNLLAFRELEAQLQRRILVSPGITIHRTDAEQFIHAFMQVVRSNPKYIPVEESEDRCIGCFQISPNVKLQKFCQDENGVDNCSSCRCRPSWCLQCMGQWFASRQDPYKKNQWMSSKCTCPMCRATFCVLDVCMLAED